MRVILRLARITHVCSGCGQLIRVAERYTQSTARVPGTRGRVYYRWCGECKALPVAEPKPDPLPVNQPSRWGTTGCRGSQGDDIDHAAVHLLVTGHARVKPSRADLAAAIALLDGLSPRPSAREIAIRIGCAGRTVERHRQKAKRSTR